MFKVDPTIPLPSVDGDLDFEKQATWNRHLARSLAEGSTFIAARLNAMLPKDGSEAMTGPLTVPSIVASGAITASSLHVTGTSALDGVVTGGALLDLSAAGASQIKFGNAHNSSNNATLDGYSDYIPYTPIFTGLGTVASINVQSKRLGDSLYLRGSCTTGTPTAVEARISLGVLGVEGSLTSDATKVGSIQLAGDLLRNAVGAVSYYTLIESGVGYITIGQQAAGTSAFSKVLGNAAFGVGVALTFDAIVPISGW